MTLQYSLNIQYFKVTLSDITVLCRMENGTPYKGENTAVQAVLKILTGLSLSKEAKGESNLPFLDTLVSPGPNNILINTVYRKPTHTDFFIHLV